MHPTFESLQKDTPECGVTYGVSLGLDCYQRGSVILGISARPRKFPSPMREIFGTVIFEFLVPKISTRVDFHVNWAILNFWWCHDHALTPSPLWMTHPNNPLRELGFDLPLILYGFDDLPNGGYFVKKCHHSVKYIWSTTIYHYRIWLPFYVIIYIPWIIKNIGII